VTVQSRRLRNHEFREVLIFPLSGRFSGGVVGCGLKGPRAKPNRRDVTYRIAPELIAGERPIGSIRTSESWENPDGRSDHRSPTLARLRKKLSYGTNSDVA
jgi:hypothetical protein